MARREFLRRMALMSGGDALAVSVLRNMGVTATQLEVAEAVAAGPPAVAQAADVAVPPDDPALEGSITSFSADSMQVLGYLARLKGGGPYPAVLIIHENRGLLEHSKDVARRMATGSRGSGRFFVIFGKSRSIGPLAAFIVRGQA